MKRYIKPTVFVFLIIFVTAVCSSLVFALNDNSPAANAAPEVVPEIQSYNTDATDNAGDVRRNTEDQTVNDTTNVNNRTVTGDINNNNNENARGDVIPETTARGNEVTDVTDAHDTTRSSDTTRDTTRVADTTHSTTTSEGNNRGTNYVMTIIISLVIIAAIIVLIIAFIPRKRHDR